jgi:hypothetical protein
VGGDTDDLFWVHPRIGRPDFRSHISIGWSLRDRLPGCGVKRFGMGPAVVLGQDLGEGARPVGDGAVADLAAGDRKLGNGHGEAAGR